MADPALQALIRAASDTHASQKQLQHKAGKALRYLPNLVAGITDANRSTAFRKPARDQSSRKVTFDSRVSAQDACQSPAYAAVEHHQAAKQIAQAVAVCWGHPVLHEAAALPLVKQLNELYHKIDIAWTSLPDSAVDASRICLAKQLLESGLLKKLPTMLADAQAQLLALREALQDKASQQAAFDGSSSGGSGTGAAVAVDAVASSSRLEAADRGGSVVVLQRLPHVTAVLQLFGEVVFAYPGSSWAPPSIVAAYTPAAALATAAMQFCSCWLDLHGGIDGTKETLPPVPAEHAVSEMASMAIRTAGDVCACMIRSELAWLTAEQQSVVESDQLAPMLLLVLAGIGTSLVWPLCGDSISTSGTGCCSSSSGTINRGSTITSSTTNGGSSARACEVSTQLPVALPHSGGSNSSSTRGSSSSRPAALLTPWMEQQLQQCTGVSAANLKWIVQHYCTVQHMQENQEQCIIVGQAFGGAVKLYKAHVQAARRWANAAVGQQSQPMNKAAMHHYFVASLLMLRLATIGAGQPPLPRRQGDLAPASSSSSSAGGPAGAAAAEAAVTPKAAAAIFSPRLDMPRTKALTWQLVDALRYTSIINAGNYGLLLWNKCLTSWRARLEHEGQVQQQQQPGGQLQQQQQVEVGQQHGQGQFEVASNAVQCNADQVAHYAAGLLDSHALQEVLDSQVELLGDALLQLRVWLLQQEASTGCIHSSSSGAAAGAAADAKTSSCGSGSRSTVSRRHALYTVYEGCTTLHVIVTNSMWVSTEGVDSTSLAAVWEGHAVELCGLLQSIMRNVNAVMATKAASPAAAAAAASGKGGGVSSRDCGAQPAGAAGGDGAGTCAKSSAFSSCGDRESSGALHREALLHLVTDLVGWRCNLAMPAGRPGAAAGPQLHTQHSHQEPVNTGPLTAAAAAAAACVAAAAAGSHKQHRGCLVLSQVHGLLCTALKFQGTGSSSAGSSSSSSSNRGSTLGGLQPHGEAAADLLLEAASRDWWLLVAAAGTCNEVLAAFSSRTDTAGAGAGIGGALVLPWLGLMGRCCVQFAVKLREWLAQQRALHGAAGGADYGKHAGQTHVVTANQRLRQQLLDLTQALIHMLELIERLHSLTQGSKAPALLHYLASIGLDPVAMLQQPLQWLHDMRGLAVSIVCPALRAVQSVPAQGREAAEQAMLLLLLAGASPAILEAAPKAIKKAARAATASAQPFTTIHAVLAVWQGSTAVFTWLECLEKTGSALASLPTTQTCNNPRCTNMAGLSEQQLVGGRSCVCGGCRAVRYCGKSCQAAHLQQHKAVCRVLAAQAAGA